MECIRRHYLAAYGHFFALAGDFNTPSVPRDVETYAAFMRTSIELVEARNRRVAAWAATQPVPTG